MASQLPHLEPITRLSPRVVRILGGNPGKFTLQGTNTYLIGTGPKRILLDTGEGNKIWPETLATALKQEGAEIDTVLLSHWHPDHVGGVKDLRAISPHARILKHHPTPEQQDIDDGQVFHTDGATLRAVHCPGHTTDHMAFVLAEEHALFTGDNVLGHGTAVFEDLAVYLSSLDAMRRQFTGRAYPGHGDVVADGPAKIDEYLSHRRQREEEILAVLREEEGEGGATSRGIVRVVYSGYPEGLWGPAEGGVVQVLKKLEGEGRVVRGEGERWRVQGRSAL
ncbi:metallo-beta-lactamase superfamily protein [Teratosphaeria destructans]|uniref:Metallo-beta-lactamase superfamily protein n=1 Tax=Teratosphaeria destructans TaxID=418781 RepID=A0A9W7SLN3_9PEZI|nr:metallo-beta-lactamase superfamily protein [Teratosphaeria destructans]